MEDVVWYNGKALRKGYTTGSCATAAAKVAALMLLRQRVMDTISIITPSGVTLRLNVEMPLISPGEATAAIRKDGGDDIDATHGMMIFARVRLRDDTAIVIDGGIGIGRITRQGLGLAIGAAAINKTPRHTIETAVREAIGPERGAQVEIFAPEGETRAQKTFNARLGILGGISIIGTSGIVTPMSEESWKSSLSLELGMKRAEGMDRVILVPGNHGQRFVQEQLHLDSRYVVTMSNFVGYMLKETERLGFEQVLLVGHFGKLVKVAAGIFHTHSHIADGRFETLIAWLALSDAPRALIHQVAECVTTEEAMAHIDAAGWQRVYPAIARRVAERMTELLRFSTHPPRCDALLFSFDQQILGSSRPVSELTEAFL